MSQAPSTTIEVGSTPPVAIGAGAAAPVPAVKPLREAQKPDRGGFIWGTGRRKRAVARVRVKPGTGKFTVNDREMPTYFLEMRDQGDCLSPLKATQLEGKIDVHVNSHGGGYMGQACAVKLGLARALMGYDPSLEPILREHSMLSRDSRKVERKKPGQPGARRRFQFSKR